LGPGTLAAPSILGGPGARERPGPDIGMFAYAREIEKLERLEVPNALDV
jgi:hypothetical protein